MEYCNKYSIYSILLIVPKNFLYSQIEGVFYQNGKKFFFSRT